MTPSVGLVIITRNRADTVVRSLGHAVECGDAGRIVVVDNGSDDGTPGRIRTRFPHVEVIVVGRNLGAAARNVGVAALHTPYVAFADDDTWWAPGALCEAAHVLERHPRVGVLSARVVVGADDRPDPACDLMANSPLAQQPDLPGPRLVAFMAGASVIRRDAFLAAGGFEPRFVIGGEERLLGWDLRRAGWSIVYVDRLVVHHHPSPARDATRRAIQQRRNELLCAWMRLPWRAAAAATRDALRHGRTDASSRRACLAALASLPWALRNRRSVPAELAGEIEIVERAVEQRRARIAATP
jgi:GT2 family glycosyltransferase